MIGYLSCMNHILKVGLGISPVLSTVLQRRIFLCGVDSRFKNRFGFESYRYRSILKVLSSFKKITAVGKRFQTMMSLINVFVRHRDRCCIGLQLWLSNTACRVILHFCLYFSEVMEEGKGRGIEKVNLNIGVTRVVQVQAAQPAPQECVLFIP
jgi:hypothetical protein